MRKSPVIILMTALTLASARAGTIQIGKLPYPGARIVEVAKGELTFAVQGSPVRITKPLDQIVLIGIDDKPAFNQAEQARTIDPAKAVALYDKAGESAVNLWEKRLISYRRLDALGRAGLIARWAQEWSQLLEGTEAPAAMKLKPARMGDESETKEAIKSLTAALEKAGDIEARAAMGVLVEQLKAHLSGKTTSRPVEPGKAPTGNGGTTDGATVKPSGTGMLGLIENLINAGEAARAMAEIDRYMEIANSRELPRVMFLAGVARLKVHQTTGAREMLPEAGVMFMKVVVFFPRSNDALEALYLAGQVSELLGDSTGAIAAYTMVGARYPDSKSEFAKRAAERLNALQADRNKVKSEPKAAKKG